MFNSDVRPTLKQKDNRKDTKEYTVIALNGRKITNKLKESK